MADRKSPVVIRRFRKSRDTASLRECLVEHQDFHRSIESSWPEGEAMVADYMAYLEAQCAVHNGRILMAQCGDETAGFVCVLAGARGEAPDDPAPFAWIQDLYVKPVHRERGVASELMAEAERFARDEGAHTLRLAVLDGNARARRFYAGRGFREYTHVLTKPLA